jgi:hypothetical protein
MIEEQHQNQLFQREDYRGQNPEKLSWVRVPVKMDYIAQKLSTIDKQCQDQSCLFQRADCRNRGHNLKKLSRVRVLLKMVFVARKLSMIKEQ